MSKFRLLQLVASIMNSHPNTPSKDKPKEKRPCLHCGKKHDHNNAFCSAECCKAHKAK